MKEFCEANPEAAKRLIRCGIGDVTEPLPPAAVTAMKAAVMSFPCARLFAATGMSKAMNFLRSKIAQIDYRERGIDIADDEIFLSDGSKSDCGFILDVLGDQNRIAITDPVYPVYVDTNVMAGHTGPADAIGAIYEGIIYLPCRAENGFVAEPPNEPVDIVYLCFPNNPTGAVATRAQLEKLGRLRAGTQGDPALRCSLRGLYQRAGNSALNFRDPGRDGMRGGIPQLLQDRRIHRGALWIHGHDETSPRPDDRRPANCRCINFGIDAGAPKPTA